MVLGTCFTDKPRLRSAAAARERVVQLRAMLPDPGPAVAEALDGLDDLLERIDGGFAGILDEMRLRRPLLPETAALTTAAQDTGDVGGGRPA